MTNSNKFEPLPPGRRLGIIRVVSDVISELAEAKLTDHGYTIVKSEGGGICWTTQLDHLMTGNGCPISVVYTSLFIGISDLLVSSRVFRDDEIFVRLSIVARE